MSSLKKKKKSSMFDRLYNITSVILVIICIVYYSLNYI